MCCLALNKEQIWQNIRLLKTVYSNSRDCQLDLILRADLSAGFSVCNWGQSVVPCPPLHPFLLFLGNSVACVLHGQPVGLVLGGASTPVASEESMLSAGPSQFNPPLAPVHPSPVSSIFMQQQHGDEQGE